MTTPFGNNKLEDYTNKPRFIVNEMGDGRFRIFEFEGQRGYRMSYKFTPATFKLVEDATRAIKEYEAEEETVRLRNTVVRKVYP